MTCRGHVKNGLIVLDDPVKLPDGAEVTIEVIGGERTKPTLGQVLLKYAGTAKGLPPNASRNLDHYLYGAPEK